MAWQQGASSRGPGASITGTVKGLEKLTSVRLAEILSQKGTVPTESITDALYAQEKHGEAFVQVLVSGGHITEWDLAKAVTEHFQIPFLMASNYGIDEDVKNRLPSQLLFQNLIVPIDVFGDVVSVVMPILTPYDVLSRIQKDANCELFPYVGLISENKKVLGTLFPEFPKWFEDVQQQREAAATRAANGDKQGGGWMSIFDAGDQAIQETLAVKKKA